MRDAGGNTWIRLFAAIFMVALAFAARSAEPVRDLDAWNAAKLMGAGVNIGTFANTTTCRLSSGNSV
jgi:hypothetical protein